MMPPPIITSEPGISLSSKTVSEFKIRPPAGANGKSRGVEPTASKIFLVLKLLPPTETS